MRRGELTTLPSGLRVASRTLPQAQSLSVGDMGERRCA